MKKEYIINFYNIFSLIFDYLINWYFFILFLSVFQSLFIYQILFIIIYYWRHFPFFHYRILIFHFVKNHHNILSSCHSQVLIFEYFSYITLYFNMTKFDVVYDSYWLYCISHLYELIHSNGRLFSQFQIMEKMIQCFILISFYCGLKTKDSKFCSRAKTAFTSYQKNNYLCNQKTFENIWKKKQFFCEFIFF